MKSKMVLAATCGTVQCRRDSCPLVTGLKNAHAREHLRLSLMPGVLENGRPGLAAGKVQAPSFIAV